MKTGIGKSVLLGATLAAVWTQQANAATGGSLDKIVNTFVNAQGGWEPAIKAAAMSVFGILVLIEVTWTLIKLAIKGADQTEFVGEIVQRVMFVGFFTFLLNNGGDFARAIIDSFRQVGSNASTGAGGSGGLSPSDIFDAGINMGTTVLATKVSLSLAGIGQATALMIAGACVVVCFALMAALMVIALVESYIVATAAIILMGFGGTRWTKDFSITALRYAVSVGVKLMAIQLISGLGESVIKAQAAAISVASVQKPEEIMVVLGFGIVMLALTKSIPDILQGIVNGTSISSGGGQMTYQMAGGAIAAVAGAGTASVGAMRLASAQLQSEGAPRGLMNMAERTVQNLAGAAAGDIGARLGGRARGGSMGGRMGYDMAYKTAELQRAGAKPALPQGADQTVDTGQSSGGRSAAAGAQSEGTIKAGQSPEPAMASAASSAASASAAAAAPGATAGQQTYTAPDGTPTQEAPAQPSYSWSSSDEGAGSSPGPAQDSSGGGSAPPIRPNSSETSDEDPTRNSSGFGPRLGGRGE